jgi:transitional endoplasmic reticulum ATPase
MPLAEDVDLIRLAEITHGYVGADIQALCTEAGMAALRRIMPSVKFEVDQKPKLDEGHKVQVTSEDFMTAYKEVEPTSTREFMSERPNVFFKDIGGLHQIKKNLLSMMRLPLRGASLFAHSRLTPPRGGIFSGPSGTGKTLMAKAIAGEMGMTLFTVDPPTLLSKWVGESEKGLREVFKRAKQASPCILFFDEIEAMAPARSAEDTGAVSQRIVSQLFRELDGLQSSLGVMIIAATHRSDMMEPALLRSGRFDSVIEFPLPSKEERLEILQMFLQTLPFRTEVDINALAERTDGWTGADIETMCKKAVLSVVDEALCREEKPDYSNLTIASEHFEQAADQAGAASTIKARALKR